MGWAAWSCAPPEGVWSPEGRVGSIAAEGDEISLQGSAANAKGGAVLLVGPAEVPVYIANLDGWPPELFGQTVRLQGRLERMAGLPEAAVLEGGAITQGVQPGTRAWWLLEGRVVEQTLAPAAVPFAFAEEGWPDLASCLTSTRAALVRAGESPERFRVNLPLETVDDEARIGLWGDGRPGRDARCEVSSGEFGGFLFWQ